MRDAPRQKQKCQSGAHAYVPQLSARNGNEEARFGDWLGSPAPGKVTGSNPRFRAQMYANAAPRCAEAPLSGLHIPAALGLVSSDVLVQLAQGFANRGRDCGCAACSSPN